MLGSLDQKANNTRWNKEYRIESKQGFNSMSDYEMDARSCNLKLTFCRLSQED